MYSYVNKIWLIGLIYEMATNSHFILDNPHTGLLKISYINSLRVREVLHPSLYFQFIRSA